MFKKYPAEDEQEAEFQANLTIDKALDVVLDESQPLTREDYFSKLRRHLIPMTYPFFGLGLAIKIYRFEEFHAAYHDLCAQLDLPLTDMPHLRKTVRQPYKNYFTLRDSDRAQKIFAKDCETFGYHY